jgi:spermidine synthase
VESNNELITWTNSEGFLDDGINIIEGDALNYTPDKKYDLIVIDLWWKESDITEEIKTSLKNNYLSHLNTNGRLILCLLPLELK